MRIVILGEWDVILRSNQSCIMENSMRIVILSEWDVIARSGYL